MSTIARDSLTFLRQDRIPLAKRVARLLPIMRKSHARWIEALRSTLALWLFVLLVFLPVIVERHPDEPWIGTVLDCSTVLISIGLAMIMYLASRATIGLPTVIRLPLRAAAVIAAAGTNTVIDLLFQGWIADHVVQAWQSLPTDFTRAYSSMLSYILVFSVNMILFHVNCPPGRDQPGRRIAEVTGRAGSPARALRYQLNLSCSTRSIQSRPSSSQGATRTPRR